MDNLQGNEPRDTGFSVDESILVQGKNEQEEEDLEDRRRREAELHNIISARLGNISYDDDQSINSNSFDSTSTSRYQSNLAEGDHYKDASLNSFEQLQIMYEARVNEQKELRQTIDEMKVQHKADSDDITRKMYLLEADFNRVQYLYQQAQEVLGEKNLELKEKETRLAELTQIVTDLTTSRNQVQDELSSWKQTHSALEQKLQLMEKGINKNVSEKQIRSRYEQEISKLQSSIIAATRKYENAEIEINALKRSLLDIDEKNKQFFSQETQVCDHCTDHLKEISNLETNLGISKGVEAVKLKLGDHLTHDHFEATLSQYLSSLRQLMEIFPKLGEVDELQAEVASLAQTVVVLKKQFAEKKSNENLQELLNQKDLDIDDLKEIILKLQTEKKYLNNDLRDAILSLKDKENKVAGLTHSLHQLTQDEINFKSDEFEQEKARDDLKRTAGQEGDTLDGIIDQVLLLADHFKQQVEKLKASADIDCVERLTELYMTTKLLKATDQAFRTNLGLKMSAEDEGNKKVKAFAQKVAILNEHRTCLEQKLIEQLATYAESNSMKDEEIQNLTELLEELSVENANLQHELTVKIREDSQMENEKDEYIDKLVAQLEKITLEQQSTARTEEYQMENEKDEYIDKLEKQLEKMTLEQQSTPKTEESEMDNVKDEYIDKLEKQLEKMILEQQSTPKIEESEMDNVKDEYIDKLEKQLEKMILEQQSTPKIEDSQMIKEKNKQIRGLQRQVEKITLEKIEAQKIIITRDEELTRILTKGTEWKMSPVKSVPKSSKKPLPEAKKVVPEAKKNVPETKKNAPEAKKLAPEAKKIVPEAKKIVPEAKKIVPETKKMKSVLEAKKNVPEVKKAAVEAKKIGLQAKSVTDVKKFGSDARKSVTDARKSVPDVKKFLSGSLLRSTPEEDEAELKRLNESIRQKHTELANLRKECQPSVPVVPDKLRNKVGTPKSGPGTNRTQKGGALSNRNKKPDGGTNSTNSDYESSEQEELNTNENDTEYTELVKRYNEYDQKFVLQQIFVEELKNKITALKTKLKEFEKVQVNPRRVEHFEQENLRLQGQNANLNSDLTAAQILILEMSEKIEQFESQGELIEDMKKKSHIFQEYMNEQISLRRVQPPVAVTNSATNTSDLADESSNGTKQAQRLEVFNNILEKKNEQYRIMLEENKCLKEKISFDRSALNDLTEAWNGEIDRLKVFAEKTTKKNRELADQVKVLTNNLTTCQNLFQCVSNKLTCANEIVDQFYTALKEPNPDVLQLQHGMTGFLTGLENKIGNCLKNTKS